MSFVHLHVHSQYSLLDGFSDLKKLVSHTRQMEMPAVALTDHGTMFGVIDFFNAANAEGIKPIIGLEAYMAPRRMTDREAQYDKRTYHVLLLAENQTGYLNLLQIASASQLEGFYYKPRIDHAYLASHAEGLICTSACMAGEIPRTYLEEGEAAALKKMDWYFDVFGRDHFFLELQRHNIDDLEKANQALLRLGKRYDARFVATNDVHYVERSDSVYQDILLAIQTGSLLTDPGRMKMNDDSYFLRSPAEMAALFADIPHALPTTLEIAERCNVNLAMTDYHLPVFEVPEGYTTATYLRMLCEQGLQRRYGSRANSPEVRERLETELGVIHTVGFDAYFLIVWDLCCQANRQGIWYNARGSAAGSLVAYALDITNVEPLGHGLIFERFLNPARVNMPDIDLDFQDDRRADIMQYCADKYGADRVSQIITFGTLGAKAAIRDVGRVKDIPLSEVDRVAKLIPGTVGMTIQKAYDGSPELKEMCKQHEYLRDLLETAQHMEGAIRNAGTHACGVIITDVPITAYAPLHRPTSNSEDNPIKTVAQFDMAIVDSLGLLKVDFLGLATLTIMQRACDLIEKRHGIRYNLENIPLDDPETFAFMGQGHTAGVFQLEGSGMTRYLMQMKPRNLANIIAMVALYRPGPMQFIPQYIRRMHGEEKVEYRDPKLEPLLNETYGIPIYQEQIMFAAMELASFTASEADGLRKAISKKKAKQIEIYRKKFVEGAVLNQIERHVAEQIFIDWEDFARYGFNKSHAADYGVIAVETAYLKAHYTVEYMTALLSASKNDTDKVAVYVADSQSMGVEVLPPDINYSDWDFSIEDREDGSAVIRFGMGAVKNVGRAPIETILSARGDVPFTDLGDFARRVDLRHVGKRPLDSLIRVGALDAWGSRGSILQVLDRLIAISASHFKAAESGQLSFFGALSTVEEELELPLVDMVDPREKLEWERELLGLYVSDHPLSPYMGLLKSKVSHFLGQLRELPDKKPVVVAGMIVRMRRHQTKKGDPMAFATIEDLQGTLELVLFPRVWQEFAALVEVDNLVLVRGKVDADGSDPKVLVDHLELIAMEEARSIPQSALLEIPDPLDFADMPSWEEFDEDAEPDFDFEASDEEAVRVSPACHVPPAEEGMLPGVLARPDTLQEMRLPFEPARLTPSSAPEDHLPPTPAGGAGRYDSPVVREAPQSVSEPDDPFGEGPPLPADWVIAPRPARRAAPPGEERAASPTGTPPETPGTDRSPVRTAPPARPAGNPPARVSAVPMGSPEAFQLPPYIVPPAGPAAALGLDLRLDKKQEKPRMLTVVLHSSGDKRRDHRRLQRLHGILRSCPGLDRFSLMIQEAGHNYLVEFPNNTTGITTEMLRRVSELIGEENVRVTPISVH